MHSRLSDPGGRWRFGGKGRPIAMVNNLTRRVDVFFYGLFMDETLLQAKGIEPQQRRLAVLENFRLMIGERHVDPQFRSHSAWRRLFLDPCGAGFTVC
jgi:hypothetical protein